MSDSASNWVQAAYLRRNTLHGFAVVTRASDNEVELQLALFDEHAFGSADACARWLDAIRERSGATSLHTVHGLGSSALAIDVRRDYDKRRAVLDAALALLPTPNATLTLQTQLAPCYRRGQQVTAMNSELAFLRCCESVPGGDKLLLIPLRMMRDRPCAHVGMWCSPAMRGIVQQFIDAVQLERFVPDPNDAWEFGAVVDELLDWPHVASTTHLAAAATTTRTASSSSSSPPSPSKTATPTHTAADESDTDDTSCMICLDRAPSTMVLPCMHVVVCSQCSESLRATADHHTCVQCRRPITEILQEVK